MRRNYWSLLGAAAGLALALFLLFTPVDRDSLFLDGVQTSATAAWEELLNAARDLDSSEDLSSSEHPATARPLHLDQVAIDPAFLDRHIGTGTSESVARDQLTVDLKNGRDPERDLIARVHQSLRALMTDREDAAPAGTRYHPVTWPGDDAPADAVHANLILRPFFLGTEENGEPEGSGLELELTAPGSDRLATGRSSHSWPSSRSLWPPLLAILLAVLIRRTVPALLAAVVLGCWLITSAQEGMTRVVATAEYFVVDLLYQQVWLDSLRPEILLFVVFLSMSVGVMSRAGGIHGMVALLSRFAVGPRSTQLVAYASGVLIFFDDYANCIIVGNTMRPLSDLRRISREKLAYIVDSTAAPVAAISLFSTWIAYEISMFAPQLSQANPLWTEAQGFEIFLRTIPFRFYCLLTLFFIPATILLKREFGPMRAAERRARLLGQPIDPRGRPMVQTTGEHAEAKHPERARARHALLPILALISVTIFMLAWTGRSGDVEGADWGTRIRGVLFHANSTRAIFIGSVACFGLAAFFALNSRILSLGEVLLSAWRSARALFFAIVILLLAWGIGEICEALETASYLVAVSKDWIVPEILPAVLFGTACMISFAIGSSWSTMAILLPNVVVLAWVLGERSAMGSEGLLVLSLGAVLEGSIFGDHCSPISDTTVLSSVATASDHLHHVKTQAPYAMTVMGVSVVICYLPVAIFGFSSWLCLAVAALVLAGILLTVGADPADPRPEGART